MLLGLVPKDFDVATNAHPEQVRRLFRNCRLIGRRFRLAHVYFGPEIIEVATFRAPVTDPAVEHKHVRGMLLRDNVYGSLEEDVWRRDFTINALYYNIMDFSLVDFCNGMADIQHGLLRMIGEPRQRYSEDPVRLLRAIRLASKLNFAIEEKTAEPIKELGWLLEHVAPARLYEEILKLFLTGHASKSYELLLEYQILPRLLPDLFDSVTGQIPLNAQALISQALVNIDQRLLDGKTVSPVFLYAVFLWYPYQKQLKVLKITGAKEASGTERAMQMVLSKQIQYTAIPKRTCASIKEIWSLQSALIRRRPKQLSFILTHRRFRAAYDFLLLRTHTEENLREIVDWWTIYQAASEEEQQQMVENLPPIMRKVKSHKKPKRPPAQQ